MAIFCWWRTLGSSRPPPLPGSNPSHAPGFPASTLCVGVWAAAGRGSNCAWTMFGSGGLWQPAHCRGERRASVSCIDPHHITAHGLLAPLAGDRAQGSGTFHSGSGKDTWVKYQKAAECLRAATESGMTDNRVSDKLEVLLHRCDSKRRYEQEGLWLMPRGLAGRAQSQF